MNANWWWVGLLLVGCVPASVSVDGGLMGSDDDGGVIDDLSVAEDWTQRRGAPLVVTSLPAMTTQVPAPYGGLFHLTASATVLATGRCGVVGGSCELKWLDAAGVVTHRESEVLVPEWRTDSREVLYLARAAQTFACQPDGVRLGVASALHLDTGALIQDFAQNSSGIAANYELGVASAEVFASAPTSGRCDAVAHSRLRWAVRPPGAAVVTAEDELAAAPERFVLTQVMLQNPRRLQVVERDQQAPQGDRVLLTVTDADEYSHLTLKGSDAHTLVVHHEPGDSQVPGTIYVVDRDAARVVHTIVPPSRYFALQPFDSLRWFWFCTQPVGATFKKCVVKDGRGEVADRTLELSDFAWVRDDSYVVYAKGTGEASVLDAVSGVLSALEFKLDDGHLRVVDADGVHDLGGDATLLAALPFHAWGLAQTRLVVRVVRRLEALELWHVPSGRHVRVSNSVFTSSSSLLCAPGLIIGVGETHPGLYSFVEPSAAGDGMGELFIGDAELLAPPRSFGLVSLAACRRPRASIDGQTIGLVLDDGQNVTIQRTSFPRP